MGIHETYSKLTRSRSVTSGRWRTCVANGADVFPQHANKIVALMKKKIPDQAQDCLKAILKINLYTK